MEGQKKKVWIVLGIIAVLAMVRLFPHPPNFTPIGAIAIFAGVHFGRNLGALLIPAVLLTLTDLISGQAFYEGFLWVYAAYVPVVLLGRWIRSNRNPLSIGISSVLGAVVFYLISNFGIWLQGVSYPNTWEGLTACYAMALPFLRNDILGTMFFSFVIFVVYDMFRNAIPEIELD